jgi:hypothetical protein
VVAARLKVAVALTTDNEIDKRPRRAELGVDSGVSIAGDQREEAIGPAGRRALPGASRWACVAID